MNPLLIAFVSAASAAASTPAQPAESDQARVLASALADEVVHVRPYEPGGLDLHRGFVMETRPRRTTLGDCRSQRITFFLPFRRWNDPPEPPRLGELRVSNRYRWTGWPAAAASPDCGDPLDGTWITADEDAEFNIAARALTQVLDAARIGPTLGAYPFTVTCAGLAGRCDDLASELRAAFRWRDLFLSRRGGKVVLETEVFTLTMTIGNGGHVTEIAIKHRPPVLS